MLGGQKIYPRVKMQLSFKPQYVSIVGRPSSVVPTIFRGHTHIHTQKNNK